ncbi:hypothetical protein ACLB2K_042616 [Fragaria x ananassa]
MDCDIPRDKDALNFSPHRTLQLSGALEAVSYAECANWTCVTRRLVRMGGIVPSCYYVAESDLDSDYLSSAASQAHYIKRLEGFEKPLVACCGHGGQYNYNRYEKCGTKKIIDDREVVIANSCKDPTIRVNWDGTHFTEVANKWIFQQIVNGCFSYPPNPLEMACQRRNTKNYV